MEKQELEQLKENLKQQYYEKTCEKVRDNTYIIFTNKLIDDLKRHIYYYYLCEFDEDIYDYFFYSEFLEDLLDIYIKEKGMTMNDIKNILYVINSATFDYSDKFTYLDVCLAEGLAKAVAIDIINLLF